MFSDGFRIIFEQTSGILERQTHYHNAYEIIYVTEGSTQFEINNRPYYTQKGSIIFISNLESHSFKITACPYKRYFILIKPDLLQSFVSDPVLSSIFKNRLENFNHIINLSGDVSQEISEIISSIFREYTEKKAYWDKEVKALIQMLFVSLYRNYESRFPLTSVTSSMSAVIDVQRRIEVDFLKDMTLQDIAKEYHMDMYHLSHLFRKVTGFSFKEYLILQRLSHAKDILIHTDTDVTNAGSDSGFGNVNHFIRIFKKYEGITPYKYRKAFAQARQ